MTTQCNTVIDLFCGCGGFSKGFEDAGYKVLIGIDNNQDALNTFELNHKDSQALKLDLSQDDAMFIINEAIQGQKVDVVIGSPPCQGFSLAGQRKLEDPRNTLYKAMVRAVEFFKPQAFMLENVHGIATLYNGTVKKEIVQCFEKLGYTVTCSLLNAADYGVPQTRKRFFIVGKKDGVFEFPEATHAKDARQGKKPYVTCKDAIGDLPSLVDNLGEEVADYDAKPFTDYQKAMRGCHEAI